MASRGAETDEVGAARPLGLVALATSTVTLLGRRVVVVVVALCPCRPVAVVVVAAPSWWSSPCRGATGAVVAAPGVVVVVEGRSSARR